MNRRFAATVLGLFLLGVVLFLINIQFPRTHNFDEFHYIPAAKKFIEMKDNPNWEHPPLAKMLIAPGLLLFGDRPFGWRFMAVLFGALTLSGMYAWGYSLFKNEKSALYVTLLTLFDQLLYVQARIAMLDTFMIAFLVWSFALMTFAWNEREDIARKRRLLLWTGVLMGLATACKWFAVIPLTLTAGWWMVFFLIHHFNITPSSTSKHEKKKKKKKDRALGTIPPPANDKEELEEVSWIDPHAAEGIGLIHLFLALAVIPFFTYFATFLPFLLYDHTPHYTLMDLWNMQGEMYAGQLRVVSAHPYNSVWSDWAILKRPIWYAFDREGTASESVRGVLLLGNPLIMWTGLLAIVFCGIQAISKKSRTAMIVFTAWCGFYFCWAIIPRKVNFYYYYYPAGLTLSLALTYVFDEANRRFGTKIQAVRWIYLGAAFGLFVYFFPVLAALKIPADGFIQYMWFRTWI